MNSCVFSRFLMVFLLLCCTAGVFADELPLGLVTEKPAEGPFVKTERGFMVPYTETIPGTEVTFRMIPVPGGEFRMGSPDQEEGRKEDEGLQFDVTLEPYWMAETELTWAEYKVYMSLYNVFKKFELQRVRKVTDDNKADAITAPTELYDPSFTFQKGENPKQPAVTMTQYAAKQYTKWLSKLTGEFYRLPTEAEWEYACRAGSETPFGFGDDTEKLGDYAWYRDNADETTHPVGEKKPNAFGLFDIHGNVAEWVLDEYSEEGYLQGGKKLAGDDAVAWPTKLFPRVVRGGHWDSKAEECRCAARLPSNDLDWKMEDPNFPLSPWWFTSDPARGVGFRLVRPLSLPAEKDLAKYWEPDVGGVKDDVDNRLMEGRGVLGIVDETLPEAIEQLKK